MFKFGLGNNRYITMLSKNELEKLSNALDQQTHSSEAACFPSGVTESNEVSIFIKPWRIKAKATYIIFKGQFYWFGSVNPKNSNLFFLQCIHWCSLAGFLTEGSLARLVDVLIDVLWMRKLFHRGMRFLVSHLSGSWREVFITLLKNTPVKTQTLKKHANQFKLIVFFFY